MVPLPFRTRSRFTVLVSLALGQNGWAVARFPALVLLTGTGCVQYMQPRCLMLPGACPLPVSLTVCLHLSFLRVGTPASSTP